MDNPALCELVNGDIVYFVGVNFKKKICVTCSYCSYLVLVDFELVLSRSTFVYCSVVRDHLQVTLGPIGKFFIQTLFFGSSENF